MEQRVNKASLFGYVGIAAFGNLFNIVITICHLDLQPIAKPDLLPLPGKKKASSEDKLDDVNMWHKVPNIA